MDDALRQKLETLPAEPGCYLMKDRAGAIVYVGKASNLRSRVRSYFDAGRGDDRLFVALLDDLLGDLEVIVTRSEKEAVLLENELIKKHKPRFNIRLRDDKNFIVLRLSGDHAFPRLEVRRAREKRQDGARYFGPYSSASSIRETLRVVNRHFQLRTCTDHVFDHRRRPCILFQIKRCPAPCVYEVPQEEYRRSVEDAIEFLEGRESELVDRLRARMEEAAGGLRFEEAARLRDQLQAVERSLEKQRVLFTDLADRDVLGLYREGPDLVIQVLAVRAGKLQDAQSFPFRGQEFPADEILSSFLSLYYEQGPAPDEVLLPFEPDEAEALAEVLSERRGRRVKLLTPQRGAKADLLEVAARNAEQGFRSWHERDERREQALAALTRALHLARPPRWMECYDISTFQGALAVGSGVSVRDGEPDKADYRRYKVKGVAGQDDFAMLHEVITRRLKRAVAEQAFPDLLVIDGGKGQLNAALAAAQDLGVPVKPLARQRRGAVRGDGRPGQVPADRRHLPRHHPGGGKAGAPGGGRGGDGPGRGRPGRRRRGGREGVRPGAGAERRAGLPAGAQGPGGAAPELGRALPAHPPARRGPPLRHHLPPQAPPGAELPERARGHPGGGGGAEEDAPAPLRLAAGGAGGDAGAAGRGGGLRREAGEDGPRLLPPGGRRVRGGGPGDRRGGGGRGRRGGRGGHRGRHRRRPGGGGGPGPRAR